MAPSFSPAQVPPLPNPDGRGVHVLALAADPAGAVWAGTYGQGVYVLRSGAAAWEHLTPNSSDLVHAFAFGSRGEIWYGTVGHGWSGSPDSGKTWTTWDDREHVAPNGIVTLGDTVYIATATGIKRSSNRGTTWEAITGQYTLALAAGPDGSLWAGHLKGIARSSDGGRTWRQYPSPARCEKPECANRVRAILVDRDGPAWVGTEQGLYRIDPVIGSWIDRRGRTVCGPGPVVRGCRVDLPPITALVRGPGAEAYAATASGVYGTDGDALNSCDAVSFATALLPFANGWYAAGRPGGLVSCRFDQGATLVSVTFRQRPDTETSGLRHSWFVRPIALDDQPYVDQTNRYGSKRHQDVVFNNAAGTPVHAIGDGVVVFAGTTEQDANTVAVRHDRLTKGRDGAQRSVFSVYSHNRAVLVSEGQHVKAGDVIAQVGSDLHLEVRVDSANVNPELWIAPLPGTGVVAGQVWDAEGRPVREARVYGLLKAEPQETPYSYAETYGEQNHPDPVYQEHFAVSDVPRGDYTLTVDVSGRRLTRRVRVQERALTWVEFRFDAH